MEKKGKAAAAAAWWTTWTRSKDSANHQSLISTQISKIKTYQPWTRRCVCWRHVTCV